MTDAEKISNVQTLVEHDEAATDALVTVYLNQAQAAMLHRRYPFGIPTEYDLSAYDDIQCELASRYFLRRGGQGEISHSENGVNRTYQSVNDEDLLRVIPQIAKVM